MNEEIKTEENLESIDNSNVNVVSEPQAPVEPVNTQPTYQEPVYEKPKKKRKTGKIIYNVVVTILFLVVLFEAIIGIINMQRLNDDKKPVWYMNKSYEKTDKKEETTYNLGLYKIVKTETTKETKIALKPFFLK